MVFVGLMTVDSVGSGGTRVSTEWREGGKEREMVMSCDTRWSGSGLFIFINSPFYHFPFRYGQEAKIDHKDDVKSQQMPST